MKEYEDAICEQHGLTMQKVIDICKELIPDKYKYHPYQHPELQNGLALLKTEDGLNSYIAAYGEMHMVKCRAALQNFPYEQIKNTGTIEIVDWGCGQGTGSLCVIEALEQHELLMWLKKVTLVEPSHYSQSRAIMNVTKATNGTIKIIPINTFLPGDKTQNEVEGLDYSYQNVIHVFSNILDVTDINLQRLACMVAKSGHTHYILCIGPMNSKAYRINQFCNIFGNQEYFSNICNTNYGRTTDTFHIYTCKTKCFVYDNSPLNLSNINNIVPSQINDTPVYNEYDPQLAVQNGLITQSVYKLYSIFSIVLNDEDILLLKPDIYGDRPDIVIIRPNKGILLVDVFEDDITKYRFVNDKNEDKQKTDFPLIQHGEDKPIDSPITIVSTFQKNLIRLHIKDMIGKVIKDNRNWGIIKKLVLFADNNTSQAWNFFYSKSNYTAIYGKDLFINSDMQKSLLHNMRFDIDNYEFDETMMRNFMRIITPKWHSYKEGKSITLTTVQKNLSKSIPNKKQKISGVAGSGKTQVLATRAVNAQVRSSSDVLILTYNISLANYMRYRIGEIKADFAWDKIHIDYYHQFFRSQANRCCLHVNFGSYEETDFFDDHIKDLPKFSAIFIDEVQDYNTLWLQILNKYFLADNGEFVVFGDPKQNVYQRPLDTNGDIRLEFIGGLWNHDLKDGKRYSNPQLAKLAMDFQLTFFSKFPIDSFSNAKPIQGSLLSNIKYMNIGKITDTQKLSDYCCNIIKKYQLRPEETVIIAQAGDILRDIDYHYRITTGLSTTTTFISKEEHDELLRIHHIQEGQKALNNDLFKNDKKAIEHNKKIQFSMDTTDIKLSTIYSYKGWESPSVILILEPETLQKENYCISAEENVPDLIYTAITRAKENLFIINLGNEKYHNFFNNNIKN